MKTLDVSSLITADKKASEIADKFETWNSYRQGWLEERKELRNYIFATDTRTTTNSRLPWSNSTTTPKLTQLYDNLKANLNHLQNLVTQFLPLYRLQYRLP